MLNKGKGISGATLRRGALYGLGAICVAAVALGLCGQFGCSSPDAGTSTWQILYVRNIIKDFLRIYWLQVEPFIGRRDEGPFK